MKAAYPFSESRMELLRSDPELAAAYLEECLADGDINLFKTALKHVAEARLGGMSALSKATDLNRESLYKSLSEQGNPSLESLAKILGAMGMRIAVSVSNMPMLSKSPNAVPH
jgi:probable addiction module antidote protein